jgi:roadblock/LC7 domain-containing protein
MEELAELDEGGEAAALMSAEGFKAYADDSIWVSMIPTRVKWGGGFLACVTGGGGAVVEAATLMSVEVFQAYADHSI